MADAMKIPYFLSRKKKSDVKATFYKGSGYIDLYHHLTRALWFDLSAKRLIDGDEAIQMQKMAKREIGFLPFEQGLRADVWGNGEPTVIYGTVYEFV
jgi:hypothetical protein